jgi:uncharacterized membrane protein
MTNLLRIVFTLAYVINDIIYFTMSKQAYDVATKRIQGTPMVARLTGGALAWIALGLGWYFLVAPAVEKASLAKAAALGFVYGFAVYGVINGSMNALFTEWRGYIMMRDMLWGVTSVTVLTTVYALVLKQQK